MRDEVGVEGVVEEIDQRSLVRDAGDGEVGLTGESHEFGGVAKDAGQGVADCGLKVLC